MCLWSDKQTLTYAERGLTADGLLTTQDWRRVLGELRQGGATTLVLSGGGEVLLNRETPEILRCARLLGFGSTCTPPASTCAPPTARYPGTLRPQSRAPICRQQLQPRHGRAQSRFRAGRRAARPVRAGCLRAVHAKLPNRQRHVRQAARRPRRRRRPSRPAIPHDAGGIGSTRRCGGCGPARQQCGPVRPAHAPPGAPPTVAAAQSVGRGRSAAGRSGARCDGG